MRDEKLIFDLGSSGLIQRQSRSLMMRVSGEDCAYELLDYSRNKTECGFRILEFIRYPLGRRVRHR